MVFESLNSARNQRNRAVRRVERILDLQVLSAPKRNLVMNELNAACLTSLAFV